MDLHFSCNQTKVCPLLQFFFKHEFSGTTVFLQPVFFRCYGYFCNQSFSGTAVLPDPRL